MEIDERSNFILFVKTKKGLFSIFNKRRNEILRKFPKEKDDHLFIHVYEYSVKGRNLDFLLRSYAELCRFLNINIGICDRLESHLNSLLRIPERNRTKEDFKKNTQRILNTFKVADKEVLTNIRGFTDEECLRINEAIRCINAQCYYSTIIMTVSAIEARLHDLIKRKNKRLYESSFKKATLGDLIKLFDPDEYKNKKFKGLKKILPDKYRPLIETFNVYRIFSAHPKKEIIERSLAESVLKLGFLLLTDPQLKIS